MCDKAILENGGALKSAPDCYKNQETCNKASKVIKVFTALHADENILYFNEDSGNVLIFL